MVMKIKIDPEYMPEWWMTFVTRCNNVREFTEVLEKHEVTVSDFDEHGKFTLHFKSEQDYLLFLMR